jgi:hypothetical protein
MWHKPYLHTVAKYCQNSTINHFLCTFILHSRYTFCLSISCLHPHFKKPLDYAVYLSFNFQHSNAVCVSVRKIIQGDEITCTHSHKQPSVSQVDYLIQVPLLCIYITWCKASITLGIYIHVNQICSGTESMDLQINKSVWKYFVNSEMKYWGRREKYDFPSQFSICILRMHSVCHYTILLSFRTHRHTNKRQMTNLNALTSWR